MPGVQDTLRMVKMGPPCNPRLGIVYSMATQNVTRQTHLAVARTSSGTTTPSTKSLVLEQHFSPKQLATLWGYSPPFIRGTFRDEPGVIKVDRPEEMHKRSYCSMRIPKSVAHRVHCRLQAKWFPACKQPGLNRPGTLDSAHLDSHPQHSLDRLVFQLLKPGFDPRRVVALGGLDR